MARTYIKVKDRPGHPKYKGPKTTVPDEVANPPVKEPLATTLNFGGGDALPPPLPLVAAPSPLPGSSAPAGAATPILPDAQLQSALAKTFKGSMKGLTRGINLALQKTSYEVEIEDIGDDEAGFWAEFAVPVFKEYFPSFQKDAKIALLVATGLILSGKLNVKKRIYVNGNPEPERS